MSARRQRVLAFLTDAAEEAKAYSLDNTHLSLSGKLEVEKWFQLPGNCLTLVHGRRTGAPRLPCAGTCKEADLGGQNGNPGL